MSHVSWVWMFLSHETHLRDSTSGIWIKIIWNLKILRDVPVDEWYVPDVLQDVCRQSRARGQTPDQIEGWVMVHAMPMPRRDTLEVAKNLKCLWEFHDLVLKGLAVALVGNSSSFWMSVKVDHLPASLFTSLVTGARKVNNPHSSSLVGLLQLLQHLLPNMQEWDETGPQRKFGGVLNS